MNVTIQELWTLALVASELPDSCVQTVRRTAVNVDFNFTHVV